MNIMKEGRDAFRNAVIILYMYLGTCAKTAIAIPRVSGYAKTNRLFLKLNILYIILIKYNCKFNFGTGSLVNTL